MDTLVLSHAYEPVARVGWQRAICLLWEGKVEVIEQYEDRTVRSVTLEIKIPSIIRFLRRVRGHRRAVKFSRENVYARDHGRWSSRVATRWSCGRDSNPHWRPSRDRASTRVGLPQGDGAPGRIRSGTGRCLRPSPLPGWATGADGLRRGGPSRSRTGVSAVRTRRLPSGRWAREWCRSSGSNGDGPGFSRTP